MQSTVAPPWSSRRAQSDIVSALILVAIVVMGYGLVYTLSFSLLSNIRSETGAERSLQERLAIEDVWFRTNSTGRKLATLYVRNIGDIEVNIVSVLVGNVSSQIISTGSSTYPDSTSTQVPLGVGEVGWFNVDFSWSLGATYQLTVNTGRGSKFETSATA